MNRGLPDVQAGFQKGRGTRDQIANIRWSMEKAREVQKSLREMEIPDSLTYLLRNLYANQETTVRTLYGTSDWFKIEKGV